VLIWVDWLLVAVLIASIVIGIFRGFVREVFGLATWIIAIAAAVLLAQPMALVLEPHIAVPSLRVAAAYGIVFFVTLLVGALVTHLVALLVRKSPLSGVDRTVGGGFGLVRGVLLALVFVWLAGMTPVRQDPWWQQSLLIGRLAGIAEGLDRLVPSQWREELGMPLSAST